MIDCYVFVYTKKFGFILFLVKFRICVCFDQIWFFMFSILLCEDGVTLLLVSL